MIEQRLAHRVEMATTGWDCTCTPHPYGDGPEIDCPVHGIQACVIQELATERDRLQQALENLLGALSVWRPVQPRPDPTDCTSGYPEHIRRAWSDAIDVLEGRDMTDE